MIKYDGRKLQPGIYAIDLKGEKQIFTVAAQEESNLLKSALLQVAEPTTTQGGKRSRDQAALLDVQAKLCFYAGFPSEGLKLVDKALLAKPHDAELIKLRQALEVLAHVKR